MNQDPHKIDTICTAEDCIGIAMNYIVHSEDGKKADNSPLTIHNAALCTPRRCCLTTTQCSVQLEKVADTVHRALNRPQPSRRHGKHRSRLLGRLFILEPSLVSSPYTGRAGRPISRLARTGRCLSDAGTRERFLSWGGRAQNS